LIVFAEPESDQAEKPRATAQGELRACGTTGLVSGRDNYCQQPITDLAVASPEPAGQLAQINRQDLISHHL